MSSYKGAGALFVDGTKNNTNYKEVGSEIISADEGSNDSGGHPRIKRDFI